MACRTLVSASFERDLIALWIDDWMMEIPACASSSMGNWWSGEIFRRWIGGSYSVHLYFARICWQWLHLSATHVRRGVWWRRCWITIDISAILRACLRSDILSASRSEPTSFEDPSSPSSPKSCAKSAEVSLCGRDDCVLNGAPSIRPFLLDLFSNILHKWIFNVKKPRCTVLGVEM